MILLAISTWPPMIHLILGQASKQMPTTSNSTLSNSSYSSTTASAQHHSTLSQHTLVLLPALPVSILMPVMFVALAPQAAWLVMVQPAATAQPALQVLIEWWYQVSAIAQVSMWTWECLFVGCAPPICHNASNAHPPLSAKPATGPSVLMQPTCAPALPHSFWLMAFALPWLDVYCFRISQQGCIVICVIMQTTITWLMPRRLANAATIRHMMGPYAMGYAMMDTYRLESNATMAIP